MIIASLDDREQNNTCALHSPMSQQLCSEGQSVSNWHLIELHISIHVPLQHFVTFSSLRFSQSPLIEQSFDEATTGAIKTIRQIEDGITLTYIFVAFCQATCKDNDLLNLFMVCHGEVTCRKTVEWITFVWALTILLVAKQQSGAWCCCFHESKRVKKKKKWQRPSYFRVSWSSNLFAGWSKRKHERESLLRSPFKYYCCLYMFRINFSTQPSLLLVNRTSLISQVSAN